MLRASVYILTAFLSAQALAGGFDYVPAQTEAQKDIRKKLENSEFKRALQGWQEAFADSAFAKTQNGVATWAYALLQNGMPFFAIQTLLERTQPEHLDKNLLTFWTDELKKSDVVQKGWIQTRGGWQQIVNNAPVTLVLKKKSDIDRAFAKAAAMPKTQANARARIYWQIVTGAPEMNDIASSLRALKLIRDSGQTAIGQDLIELTQGRVLYQKGDLDGAVEAFKAVPKGSSLWIESMEERAWAHLRADDYDSALGDIYTAISPALTQLAGPETFFLANLMAYKACDYPRLFKNSEMFKKRHKQRLNDMQDLANTGTNKQLEDVITRFDNNGVSQESAGPLVAVLPHEAYRDSFILRMLNSRHEILSEVKIAQDLMKTDSRLEQLVNNDRAQADTEKSQALKRLRTLAQIDVKEYRTILNKMHILEGEVIQRLSVDESLKGERSKLSKNDDTGDALVFPIKKDEVWMDELGSYKARVKDCPTSGKGASL